MANTKSKSGKSELVGFTYFSSKKNDDTWCRVNLKNGVTGLIGKSTVYPFRDMMALKGLGVEVMYELLGTQEVNGTTYQRYALSWAV